MNEYDDTFGAAEELVDEPGRCEDPWAHIARPDYYDTLKEEKMNEKYKKLDLVVKVALVAAVSPIGFYFFLILAKLVLGAGASAPG